MALNAGNDFDCKFRLALVIVPEGLQHVAGRLSAAIPPDLGIKNELNPGGIPEEEDRPMTFGIQQNCLNNETGILPGCKFSNRSYSGDVASLNHRRMAFVLPGHKKR